MGDVLAGLPVGDLSLAGIVFIAILLIFTGRLVTRQQLVDTQADRDHWRAIADKLTEAVLKQGMTLERLLSLAEADNHALSEIQAGLQRPEDR